MQLGMRKSLVAHAHSVIDVRFLSLSASAVGKHAAMPLPPPSLDLP